MVRRATSTDDTTEAARVDRDDLAVCRDDATVDEHRRDEAQPAHGVADRAPDRRVPHPDGARREAHWQTARARQGRCQAGRTGLVPPGAGPRRRRVDGSARRGRGPPRNGSERNSRWTCSRGASARGRRCPEPDRRPARTRALDVRRAPAPCGPVPPCRTAAGARGPLARARSDAPSRLRGRGCADCGWRSPGGPHLHGRSGTSCSARSSRRSPASVRTRATAIPRRRRRSPRDPSRHP